MGGEVGTRPRIVGSPWWSRIETALLVVAVPLVVARLAAGWPNGELRWLAVSLLSLAVSTMTVVRQTVEYRHARDASTVRHEPRSEPFYRPPSSDDDDDDGRPPAHLPGGEGATGGAAVPRLRRGLRGRSSASG